jgi:hypothetical protein
MESIRFLNYTFVNVNGTEVYHFFDEKEAQSIAKEYARSNGYLPAVKEVDSGDFDYYAFMLFVTWEELETWRNQK